MCVSTSILLYRYENTAESGWLWAQSSYAYVLPTIISISYISWFPQVSFWLAFQEFSYLWHYCAGSWPFLPLELLCPWRSDTPFEEFVMKRHLKNQHLLVLQTRYSPDLLLTANIKIPSWLSRVRQLRGKAGSTTSARRKQQFWKH